MPLREFFLENNRLRQLQKKKTEKVMFEVGWRHSFQNKLFKKNVNVLLFGIVSSKMAFLGGILLACKFNRLI